MREKEDKIILLKGRYIMKHLTFLFSVVLLTSCSRYLTAVVLKGETNSSFWEAWSAAGESEAYYNYEEPIIKNLYLKMPESEFVNLFQKEPSPRRPNRPYLVSQGNGVYLVKGQYRFSGKTYEYKARFTFENGLLARYEVFYFKSSEWLDMTRRIALYPSS